VFALQGHAIAINPDGELAAPPGSVAQLDTHPAVAGETLQVLATGLGAVDPAAVTGDNSLDVLRPTATLPAVFLGGVAAQVAFSGLSPLFVGVYQLNVIVPPNAPTGESVPLQIEIGGNTTGAGVGVAIGAVAWPQWGRTPDHTSRIPVPGQDLNQILAEFLYDPLVPDETMKSGDLLVHYQVPLVDGDDVFMEFKSGVFDAGKYASQTWGESCFTWRNTQLVQAWSYTSDWRAPGSSKDFWEPVFHAALANGAVYVPGASGSIIQLNRQTGEIVRRIAPFGADPDTYETGPISADVNGNLFYNAVQVIVDPDQGFYGNDATDSWLVKVKPDGSFAKVSYRQLTAGDAPEAGDRCLGSFTLAQLPWPPSPTAVPGTEICGTQRVALNVAPAVAPDGTIYSISRSHFNARYGFLVAITPGLTKKWMASLRDRFHDGCGVPVSEGGWLPPNGSSGGCRTGALVGVDPATNRPGDGLVTDSASSSPVVAPDGSILYGAYSRYNYAQGHLMRFDASGGYVGAFGFGWDYTPAIYSHDGTWSVIVKNNHYSLGSYCGDPNFCPPDRTETNRDSPEEYFISQLSPNFDIEWSFRNANTESCTRNAAGVISCVSDHPAGFEWCVNAPAVDADGVVFANSEDGNLYAISQGGILKQKIFQQLAIGAAYTPASLGGDGKIYTQNAGRMFVVGQ
jgi:outer membrane protein assembly factor BamB